MPYTNGLVWGKPGGVLAKSSGTDDPYTVSVQDITSAELEADSGVLIRIPVHGVLFVGLTALVEDIAGGSGTNPAVVHYYGMNSIGEVGTPLEESANAVHIMTHFMHSDVATVGSTSTGRIDTVQRTYTDTDGVVFNTATGAGSNVGAAADDFQKNMQLNLSSSVRVDFQDDPVTTAGYYQDIFYLNGYFQELVVAFNRGSLDAATRFNVIANRVYS